MITDKIDAFAKKKVASLLAPLIRVRIAAAVTLTALAAFVLAGGQLTDKALILAPAVFLLAVCGSILNQVQERRSDALMTRTRHRPLASGRMSPASALGAALLTGAGGLAALLSFNRRAALAGVLALFFYNVLYTPLKKKSFLALLPGALCGSMAPAIGWLAGGGRQEDHRLVLMCGLLLLWQIPHFWLFALNNRADLERAGLFPGLPLAPQAHARRLISVWILALAAGTLLLPALKVVPPLTMGILFLVAVGWPLRHCWRWRQIAP